MTINFNIQGQSSNKASGGSKKTLGKISKKIRSNMNIGNIQKEQISNTFNLTTTAAALLAASDKNAAAFMNIETKTFESRNSNSVSGAAPKTSEMNTGVLNSSKKQNLNKTVDGNSKPQQMTIDKKLALNQRAIESRGHIRLTSHKVSSKSSYSCSQKRQREAAGKLQVGSKINSESSAIYISDVTRKADGTESSKKGHLSQTKLQNVTSNP